MLLVLSEAVLVLVVEFASVPQNSHSTKLGPLAPAA